MPQKSKIWPKKAFLQTDGPNRPDKVVDKISQFTG